MARLHKKHKHVAHENHERYLITYADMITLLLVFFIVLFSISNADKDKFLRVSTSIKEALHVNVLTQDVEGGGGGNNLEADPRFMEYLSVRSQVESMTQQLQVAAEDVDVELTRDGIVIHLSEAVLFPPGDAQLRPEGLKVLDQLAGILAQLPNEVRVEGHTDNVQPPEISAADNWELSAKRAVVTVRYLTTIKDLPPERFSAVGYGQYRPRGDNNTLDGRRKNRRVDFVIVQRDPNDLNSVTQP